MLMSKSLPKKYWLSTRFLVHQRLMREKLTFETIYVYKIQIKNKKPIKKENYGRVSKRKQTCK